MKKTLIILLVLLLSSVAVSAGDFLIQAPAGTNILILDNDTGNLNITSGTIAENGVLLSLTYCSLAGCTFTGGTVNFDSATVSFANDAIAEADVSFATACGAGNHLYVSGNDLACEADALGPGNTTAEILAAGRDTFANVSGEDLIVATNLNATWINASFFVGDGSALSGVLGKGNTTEEIQDAAWNSDITGGTQTHITVTYQDGSNNVDFVVSDDWWDALSDMPLGEGTIYIGNSSDMPANNSVSGDATLSSTGVLAIFQIAGGLDYHNVTSFPTCGGTDKLTFDGTDFTCDTDLNTGGAGNTTEEMLLATRDNYVNVTGDIMTGNLDMTNANITLDSTSVLIGQADTYAAIDASDNFVIVLGGN